MAARGTRAAGGEELPSIPTGRLAAMQSRLEVMLAAVRTVRPALDGFYQSLSDEQKARFNVVAPNDDAAAGKDQRDFTKFCDGRSPGVIDLPIVRIAHLRLEVMLAAVMTVLPALDFFYHSLSDEQKARFNALRSGGGRA